MQRAEAYASPPRSLLEGLFEHLKLMMVRERHGALPLIVSTH